MRIRLLYLVLALIVFAASYGAGSSVAAPQYHQGLGDDTLSSEPRDIPGDLHALGFPLAAPHQDGCRTRLQTTNFSSRAGARPEMLVLHYTVSSNVDGWSDVNAIYSWFNQARAQASSNYIIDFEGHCLLAVPETAKAWTQGYFNPWSISIEFIATGKEKKWPDSALKKGARVFADAAKRWGIPLKIVNPRGCTVLTGITDHERLECRNNHTDVEPYFPYKRFLAFVREYAAPKVYFVMANGEGETLVRSKFVTAGGAAEKARYLEFVTATDWRALAELKRDGDLRVVRKEGE